MANSRQIVMIAAGLRARARRWVAIGIISLPLTACSNLLPTSPSPQPVAVYGPHHCYRTLAQVDCHATPLAGEANRRMGHYETPSHLGG